MSKKKQWFLRCTGILVVAFMGVFVLRMTSDSKVEFTIPIERKVYNEKTQKKEIIETKIVYDKNGCILVDEMGNALSGPHKMICVDKYSTDDVSRFVSMDGKIGFINITSGEVVSEAKYAKATSMMDGFSLVSEDLAEFYYVNDEGKTVVEDKYIDGFTFEESQGRAARVQLNDGTWQLLNRNGIYLFDEPMKYIHKLPSVTDIGTATTVSGHTVIFEFYSNSIIRIIKEYDEFNEISERDRYGCIKVKNSNDLVGVVFKYGEIIVPDDYSSIETVEVHNEDNDINREYFICKTPEGNMDVYEYIAYSTRAEKVVIDENISDINDENIIENLLSENETYKMYVKSEPYFPDEYSLIEDENKGLKGVSIKGGNEIIPAEYAEIDFETIYMDESKLEIFVVTKPDGYVEVFIHDEVNGKLNKL